MRINLVVLISYEIYAQLHNNNGVVDCVLMCVVLQVPQVQFLHSFVQFILSPSQFFLHDKVPDYLATVGGH